MRCAFLLGCFIKATAQGNIGLTSDDGFNSMFDSSLIKMHRAKDVTMVRHGNGGHVIFNGFFDEFVDATSTVEETVLRVDVEVDEFWRTHTAVPVSVTSPSGQ